MKPPPTDQKKDQQSTPQNPIPEKQKSSEPIPKKEEVKPAQKEPSPKTQPETSNPKKETPKEEVKKETPKEQPMVTMKGHSDPTQKDGPAAKQTPDYPPEKQKSDPKQHMTP